MGGRPVHEHDNHSPLCSPPAIPSFQPPHLVTASSLLISRLVATYRLCMCTNARPSGTKTGRITGTAMQPRTRAPSTRRPVWRGGGGGRREEGVGRRRLGQPKRSARAEPVAKTMKNGGGRVGGGEQRFPKGPKYQKDTQSPKKILKTQFLKSNLHCHPRPGLSLPPPLMT